VFCFDFFWFPSIHPFISAEYQIQIQVQDHHHHHHNHHSHSDLDVGGGVPIKLDLEALEFHGHHDHHHNHLHHELTIDPSQLEISSHLDDNINIVLPNNESGQMSIVTPTKRRKKQQQQNNNAKRGKGGRKNDVVVNPNISVHAVTLNQNNLRLELLTNPNHRLGYHLF
jgi:hypothetical protein